MKEWKGGVHVHVTPISPVTADRSFHAALLSKGPGTMSFRTDDRPGTSQSNHAGFQVNLRGEWKGAASIVCNSHCLGARIVESHDGGDAHTLTVTPSVWRPGALVTVRFGANARVHHLAHASLVTDNTTWAATPTATVASTLGPRATAATIGVRGARRCSRSPNAAPSTSRRARRRLAPPRPPPPPRPPRAPRAAVQPRSSRRTRAAGFRRT